MQHHNVSYIQHHDALYIQHQDICISFVMIKNLYFSDEYDAHYISSGVSLKIYNLQK